MKRVLLASVCIIAVAGKAQAQVAVIDPTGLVAQAKQLVETVKQETQGLRSYLTQLQQYATELQTYATDAEMAANFIHDPSLGAATGLMNLAGVGNSLPVNPMAVMGLVNGFSGSIGSLSGSLGKLQQLSGLVNMRRLPSIDGQTLVLRKQNRMRHSGDRALSQADELTQAANLIASGRTTTGQHAHAVTVFADSHEALTDAIQTAWGDFGTGGIKVERADITLEGVLFSMVPCNFHLRGQNAAISSRNFAAFASLHNFPSGLKSKWRWGTPIAMFRTSGARRFCWNWTATAWATPSLPVPRSGKPHGSA